MANSSHWVDCYVEDDFSNEVCGAGYGTGVVRGANGVYHGRGRAVSPVPDGRRRDVSHVPDGRRRAVSHVPDGRRRAVSPVPDGRRAKSPVAGSQFSKIVDANYAMMESTRRAKYPPSCMSDFDKLNKICRLTMSIQILNRKQKARMLSDVGLSVDLLLSYMQYSTDLTNQIYELTCDFR
jgi:hypothetical protein